MNNLDYNQISMEIQRIRKLYVLEVIPENSLQHAAYDHGLSVIQCCIDYVNESANYTSTQEYTSALGTLSRLIVRYSTRNLNIQYILKVTYKYLELQKRRLL